MIEPYPVLMSNRISVHGCAAEYVIYRGHPDLVLSRDKEKQTAHDVQEQY
jgi:hypothetical protein